MALPNLAGLALHAAAPTGVEEDEVDYGDEPEGWLSDDDPDSRYRHGFTTRKRRKGTTRVRRRQDDGENDGLSRLTKRRLDRYPPDIRELALKDRRMNARLTDAEKLQLYQHDPDFYWEYGPSPPEALTPEELTRRQQERERMRMQQVEARGRRMEAERQARYAALLAQARAAAAAPISEEERLEQERRAEARERQRRAAIARGMGWSLEHYEAHLARQAAARAARGQQ